MLLSAGARGLSIQTRFQYRYVGVIGVGDMGKKNDPTNPVGFSVSVFLGNRKTDFKKSAFGREKPRKTDRKNDFRFSVHNPDLISYQYVRSSFRTIHQNLNDVE